MFWSHLLNLCLHSHTAIFPLGMPLHVSVTVFKDTWTQGYKTLMLITYAKTLQIRPPPEIWERWEGILTPDRPFGDIYVII